MVVEGRTTGRHSAVDRAGLITTNSITQLSHQPIIRAASKAGVTPVWAVADHPWTDEAGGANVRVAMMVIAKGAAGARLVSVSDNGVVIAERVATQLNADLSAAADVARAGAVGLTSDAGLSFRGFAPVGAGFLLTPADAVALIAADATNSDVIRPFIHGKCLADRPRGEFIIDFGQRTEEEAKLYPVLFDIVRVRVKPERDAQRDSGRKRYWWRFGRSNAELRRRITGLDYYIATPYVTKHRFFTFVYSDVAPDDKVVCIAADSPFLLGVLSGGIHATWSDAAGTRLGVGNDLTYNNPRCFDAFPFPDASSGLSNRISALAERLDAYRKSAIARDERVTMTGMYNVVEKLRSGEPLTVKERDSRDRRVWCAA